MYYLEKINTHSFFGNRDSFYMPGLIDIFINSNASSQNFYQAFTLKNIHKHFSEIFTAQCQHSNIVCGSKYGVFGIDVTELLLSVPADTHTVYELGLAEFLSLPLNIIKRLTKFNIIIHDYSEAGANLDGAVDERKIDLLHDHHSFILATDNLNNSKFNINKHLFQTVADQLEAGLPDVKLQHEKSCIVMSRKPRMHRLYLLHFLQEHNLLDTVDWSLNGEYDPASSDQTLEINFDPATTSWENELYVSSHPFLEKNKNILPKELYTPHGQFVSPNILHPDFHCAYKMYISMETYFNTPFITEKTFKSFVSGLPLVLFGNQQIVDHLHSIGFKCTRLSGDNPAQQASEIKSIIKSNKPVNYADVEHNYNLITNKEYTISLCVDVLHRMFTHYDR